MAIYSDVNQFTTTRTPLVIDVDSIFQSIENILSTIPGQRVFNPEFGSNIQKLLFDLINESTAFAIEHELVLAIGRWEPRIRLINNMTVIQPDHDRYLYRVQLFFRIVGFESQIYEYKGVLARDVP